MDLGIFSISLAVKDLQRSIDFYALLGFEVECAGPPEKWAMLKNGETRIGVFEGLFETEILTFNPPDARAIEARLSAAGTAIERATKGEAGPCHFVVKDPDGRTVMFDQS